MGLLIFTSLCTSQGTQESPKLFPSVAQAPLLDLAHHAGLCSSLSANSPWRGETFLKHGFSQNPAKDQL